MLEGYISTGQSVDPSQFALDLRRGGHLWYRAFGFSAPSVLLLMQLPIYSELTQFSLPLLPILTAIGEDMDSCAFDKLFTNSVPHILEKVFFSLDYNSFKSCLEVSRTWNEQLTS